MLHQKAFTLVELMIVIAIIMILAAALFPSMSTHKERARFSAAQSFIKKFAYLESVVSYDFDVQSGSTVIDTSGSNNHGAMVGGVYSTDTPSRNGYSYMFSGQLNITREYILSTKNMYLMGEGGMTVLYWIKTIDQINDGAFIVANASSSFGYRTGLRNGYPYFLMGSDPTPSTPNPLYYKDMTCSDIQVNDGKWHHLAFSFDFNKKEMICYVDGKIQTSISVPATIATNIGDIPSFMGSYFPNVPFVGYIDDVQIRRGVIAR